MKICNWSFQMATCVVCIALTEPAISAEPTADQRSAARIQARIEFPLANRNQKAYCDAFYGTEDYLAHVRRACEAGVKVGVRKVEQCTVQAAAADAKADLKKCLEMDKVAFDATVAKHSEVRTKFVKTMADLGIDGDKLIAEERAKIK